MSDQATDAGSKFFVIGTYVQGIAEMDSWKERGINTLVDVPSGHNGAQWIAAANAKELYQIRHPVGDLQTDAKSPYLLAWSTQDEPSNTASTLDYGVVSQDPAEVQQQAAPWRAAAAAAGVDVPIWTNHVGGHIYPTWAENNALMKDYHEGAESDWLASDSYPIQNGQPLLVNARQGSEDFVSTQQGVNAFRQEAWSGGKATMTFIGSSAYDPGQPVPTAGELKAQAWSGIINGAEGIIYFPVQLSPWDHDATPAALNTAMKELHAEIKAIDDILMNEQTGGRAAYKVFHSAQQGKTPTATQLPYGFEAAEITTESGGTYRIILNITGQERTLNKPEWGLSNVTFSAYGVHKGMADGSQQPTQPAPAPEPTPEPILTPEPTPEPTPELIDPGTTSGETPTFSTSEFTGTNDSDTIIGNDLDNTILGIGGSDVIKGGAGNDHVDGGSSADQLWGGLGNDRFFFNSVNEANGDQIIDFAKGDIIDLSAIDARSGTRTNDAFKFIGTDAFTGSSQLHAKQDVANGVTYIEGNTNRDPAADFVITVNGLHTFAPTDFVL